MFARVADERLVAAQTVGLNPLRRVKGGCMSSMSKAGHEHDLEARQAVLKHRRVEMAQGTA